MGGGRVFKAENGGNTHNDTDQGEKGVYFGAYGHNTKGRGMPRHHHEAEVCPFQK